MTLSGVAIMLRTQCETNDRIEHFVCERQVVRIRGRRRYAGISNTRLNDIGITLRRSAALKFSTIPFVCSMRRWASGESGLLMW
jgi:uncharacterized protein YjiS (DUF1127 family)